METTETNETGRCECESTQTIVEQNVNHIGGDPNKLHELFESLEKDLKQTPMSRMFIESQGLTQTGPDGDTIVVLEEIDIKILLPRHPDGVQQLNDYLDEVQRVQRETKELAENLSNQPVSISVEPAGGLILPPYMQK